MLDFKSGLFFFLDTLLADDPPAVLKLPLLLDLGMLVAATTVVFAATMPGMLDDKDDKDVEDEDAVKELGVICDEKVKSDDDGLLLLLLVNLARSGVISGGVGMGVDTATAPLPVVGVVNIGTSLLDSVCCCAKCCEGD